jgi:hypothetical protein
VNSSSYFKRQSNYLATESVESTRQSCSLCLGDAKSLSVTKKQKDLGFQGFLITICLGMRCETRRLSMPYKGDIRTRKFVAVHGYTKAKKFLISTDKASQMISTHIER